MSAQWKGLYNPERHVEDDANCCWCLVCTDGCFVGGDACRCCLEAQAAAVAAVIAPHMEAVGWACPCCQAVSDALEGKTQ